MTTFVAKNSGGVKTKPVIILNCKNKNITYSEALGAYRCSKALSVMALDWGQNRSLN